MKKHKLYKRICKQLPYISEVHVQNKRYLNKSLLKLIDGKMVQVYYKTIFMNDLYISQECHARSIIFHLDYPDSILYTGFTIIEEFNLECSVWYSHSFCMLGSQMIEPSIMKRTVYMGRPLKGKSLAKFIKMMMHCLKNYTDKYGPLNDYQLKRLYEITGEKETNLSTDCSTTSLYCRSGS